MSTEDFDTNRIERGTGLLVREAFKLWKKTRRTSASFGSIDPDVLKLSGGRRGKLMKAKRTAAKFAAWAAERKAAS